MASISVDLIRKKAEHNEGEIKTLEELSLHQENIQKIDNLQHWCKDLQILLLQSNLISRIENLSKLKKLRYLNLALNNIERIENLEKLESLEKLDLTLNFIGDISSARRLANNLKLTQLYLTGNPCSDYCQYREFVITVIPQLLELDGKEISRQERIIATQVSRNNWKLLNYDQETYLKLRETEKINGAGNKTSAEDDEFWSQKSKNTPEERIRISLEAQKVRNSNNDDKRKKAKKDILLFNKEGKPLNINQPKIPFKLYDDDQNSQKVLEVSVYKHLDSSLLNVDVHPNYVTINIKGQIFQMAFEEEISVDRSCCQRSQTSGHLIIRMPFLSKSKDKNRVVIVSRLEESKIKQVDATNSKNEKRRNYKQMTWVDDPEVPPLE